MASPPADLALAADDARAVHYARLRLTLFAARLTVTLGFLVAVVASGAARAAVDAIDSWPLQVAAVAAGLAIGETLLTLPLAWVGGFWLPRRFGLLHQPFGGWLADRAKATALGAGVGLAGLATVYGLLRATPAWWWLAAAGIFFLFYVVAAILLPVWIVPLFYRLTPLADAALRDRLLALCERVGVPAVGVWVADQSRKSRTANAAVVGVGRTRRIILFDTLTAQFTPGEIEAILAHELGHHVHGDVRRGLLAQGVLTLATFWVLDRALRSSMPWLGLDGVADPAGLPWLALVGTLAGLVTLPLSNTYSRWIERQADDFALRTTRDAAAFVAAMERLAALNLARRRPPRLEEVMLHSHPSIARRIARARATLPA